MPLRTIIRAMLAAALLIVSAIVVSSPPVISLLSRITDPALRRVAFLGLAALAGILSDVVIFALAPAATSRRRKALHALGMACVFAAGLAVLGAARWSTPLASTDQWDLATSWPFVALGGIGLVGYLLVSLIIAADSQRRGESAGGPCAAICTMMRSSFAASNNPG